ncbi:MAG: hypothetical protein HN563_01250 [Flavobacteriales bacterium]|nr:hypothetical protein [Flavobacteriales bacterium]
MDTAIDLAEQELFDEALNMIEPALSNEAKDNARAWYVAGYSHKEKFKREVFIGSSTSGLALSERDKAVIQLIKAYEIDSKTTSTPISSMSLDALDYLSKTYMNDVVSGVRGFTRGKDEEILEYFNEFVKIRSVIDKNEDWRSEEVEVEKNLARANRMLLESTSTDSEELFTRIIEHYNRAIEIDGDDYTSRYNLAINLYNRGVARLKSIDHTTAMFELMEIQDACVELFEQALNPMLAAHRMSPERKETLKGLVTIYKALSNEEESDKYKRALEAVVKADSE